jgi:hypothetical protein
MASFQQEEFISLSPVWERRKEELKADQRSLSAYLTDKKYQPEEVAGKTWRRRVI